MGLSGRPVPVNFLDTVLPETPHVIFTAATAGPRPYAPISETFRCSPPSCTTLTEPICKRSPFFCAKACKLFLFCHGKFWDQDSRFKVNAHALQVFQIFPDLLGSFDQLGKIQ
jgi:hypothetical protein